MKRKKRDGYEGGRNGKKRHEDNAIGANWFLTA